jgi:hypothetical protein
MPKDLHCLNNHLFKNPAWKTMPNKPTVKNLFELKAILRAEVAGNFMENCWKSGQNGTAILLHPTNQEGGAPWSRIQHVSLHHNVVKNAGDFISLSNGNDFNTPTPRPTGGLDHVSVFENLGYLLNTPEFPGNGRGISLTAGLRFISFISNTIVLERGNTIITLHGYKHWKGTGGPFEFSDNVMNEMGYGMHGDEAPTMGKGSLDHYFPNKYTGVGNVFGRTGTRNIQYLAGSHVIKGRVQDSLNADYSLKEGSLIHAANPQAGAYITELKKVVKDWKV